MREIKIKAWHLKRKQWYHWEPISNDYHLFVHAHEEGIKSLCGWDDTDLIKVQFTGLKDKHGKEIYEGDIIRSSASLQDGNTWQIEFKLGCFFMRFISGICPPKNGFILAHDFNLEFYEVIGNIYETPEFLAQ